ncbi:MAG: kelch repeat-containing protein [Candidatus Thermoplasmatota archaeon]
MNAAFVASFVLLSGCVTVTVSTSETIETSTFTFGPTWQPHGSLPQPLAEAGAAWEDGELKLVGGFALAAGVGPEAGGSTLALHSRDGGREWEEIASYPLPVHHLQLASIDGVLYGFGGYVGGALLPGTYVAGAGPAGWPLTALAFRLEAGELVWEPLASLPVARAAGVAVAIGERILIVGGVDPANQYPTETFWYDPVSDTYENGPVLPEGRDHLTATLTPETLVVTTGRRFESGAWDDLDSVDLLDLATLTWSRGPPAPVPGGGQAASLVNGTLWLAGGEVAEGPFAVHDEVHIFDLATRTWSEGPALPEGRHGFAAATWEGRFTVVGGALASGPITERSLRLALTQA